MLYASCERLASISGWIDLCHILKSIGSYFSVTEYFWVEHLLLCAYFVRLLRHIYLLGETWSAFLVNSEILDELR